MYIIHTYINLLKRLFDAPWHLKDTGIVFLIYGNTWVDPVGWGVQRFLLYIFWNFVFNWPQKYLKYMYVPSHYNMNLLIQAVHHYNIVCYIKIGWNCLVPSYLMCIFLLSLWLMGTIQIKKITKKIYYSCFRN